MLYRANSPHLDIFSEVTLRPNKDKWGKGGVSADLWDPLLRNVLERGGTHNTEAQQEHICTGVTQRTQLIKLILERLGEIDREQVAMSVKDSEINTVR